MKVENKIKILLVAGIYPPEIGGPATYAVEMTKELPKRGIEVEVLPFRSVKKWPKILRHLVFLIKIISQSRGKDVIFVQDTLSTGLPAVIAGKFLGKPVVLRTPGDYVWEQSAQRFGIKDSIDDFQNKKYGIIVEVMRYLQKFTARYATRVYAPSIYFSKLVSKWNNCGNKVEAIYNGIDLNFEFKNRKYDKLTMITAGRLVNWKGIDGLIGLLAEMPGWRLVIAGDGPEKTNLKNKARELNLGDRVEFCGSVPREDLLNMIAKSHVFVLNTFFESFSFQVMEALVSGTPVITTNVGNLPEIIEHEKNGILVPPGDTKAIKKYIKKIMSEPDFSRKLSENGIKRSKDFSVAKTMDKLADLIKSLKKD